mmetsp:Transcript_30394/g.80790  ORF Transcript_30394/g.80790 Transcript_30394/m.80790 type:complete len:1308 (+) Transcript_30394:142-4065(+)
MILKIPSAAILFLVWCCNFFVLTDTKSTYIVGGWIPDSDEIFLKKFQPLFESYLSSQVSALLNQSVTFVLVPADYAPGNFFEDLIANHSLDFAYVHPGQAVCLELAMGFSYLATQRVSVGSLEADGYGGLIFSKKGLNSSNDIRNKRIGVGTIWSPGGFSLPQKLLLDHGVNIFSDTQEMVFYDFDYLRLVGDVFSGTIDVGFLMSGFLEQHVPELVPSFSYLPPPATAAGYPFLTSTSLVPGFAVMSRPGLPREITSAVQEALLRITASNSAARFAGIAGFETSPSYEAPRTLLKDLGLLERISVVSSGGVGTYECRGRHTSAVDAFDCPDGFAKREGICPSGSCPIGLVCTCRPCVHVGEISIIAESNNESSSQNSTCSKMEECADVAFGGTLEMWVSDPLNRLVTFQINLGKEQHGNCVPLGAATCVIDIAGLEPGIHVVEVLANGSQAPFSPFLVRIGARGCNGHTDRVLSAAGACVCAEAALDFGGETCLPVYQAVIFFGLVLLVVVIAAIAAGRRWGRAVSEGDRVRREMVGLRQRLLLCNKQGFYLNSEWVPPWRNRSGLVILQDEDLEAAARLGLLKHDFDPEQVDGLVSMIRVHSLQRKLFAEWLLDVSLALLDPGNSSEGSRVPRIGSEHEQSSHSLELSEKAGPGTKGGNGKVWPDDTSTDDSGKKVSRSAMENRSQNGSGEFPRGVLRRKSDLHSQQARYRIFTQKVVRLQLWRADGNELFERLKEALQPLMEGLSLLCDRRYSELCIEPAGPTLRAFSLPVQCTNCRWFSGVDRQDHPEVAAVRPSDAERAEAEMQRTMAAIAAAAAQLAGAAYSGNGMRRSSVQSEATEFTAYLPGQGGLSLAERHVSFEAGRGDAGSQARFEQLRCTDLDCADAPAEPRCLKSPVNSPAGSPTVPFVQAGSSLPYRNGLVAAAPADTPPNGAARPEAPPSGNEGEADQARSDLTLVPEASALAVVGDFGQSPGDKPLGRSPVQPSSAVLPSQYSTPSPEPAAKPGSGSTSPLSSRQPYISLPFLSPIRGWPRASKSPTPPPPPGTSSRRYNSVLSLAALGGMFNGQGSTNGKGAGDSPNNSSPPRPYPVVARIHLDEEVFLAQLHARAKVLNAGFQAAVRRVVQGHGYQPDFSPKRTMSAESDDYEITKVVCTDDLEVDVVAAPIKSLQRMRQKLQEYVAPDPRCIWPLAANILDPVRSTVVCDGSQTIVEVAKWFLEGIDCEEGTLRVCRVKNMFALDRADVRDGYRDLKLFLVFKDAESGLSIIGEVQINDKSLYDIKLKMHKLYKVKRANDPNALLAPP